MGILNDIIAAIKKIVAKVKEAARVLKNPLLVFLLICSGYWLIPKKWKSKGMGEVLKETFPGQAEEKEKVRTLKEREKVLEAKDCEVTASLRKSEEERTKTQVKERTNEDIVAGFNSVYGSSPSIKRKSTGEGFKP